MLDLGVLHGGLDGARGLFDLHRGTKLLGQEVPCQGEADREPLAALAAVGCRGRATEHGGMRAEDSLRAARHDERDARLDFGRRGPRCAARVDAKVRLAYSRVK